MKLVLSVSVRINIFQLIVICSGVAEIKSIGYVKEILQLLRQDAQLF